MGGRHLMLEHFPTPLAVGDRRGLTFHFRSGRTIEQSTHRARGGRKGVAVQWWCAATGLPWSWHGNGIPGCTSPCCWLAYAWWWLGVRQQWTRRPWGWFCTAWIALLVTLDWPVGKLGAGYLASVHTFQFLMLTLLVGPALLRSIPEEGWLAFAPVGSQSSPAVEHDGEGDSRAGSATT